MLKLFYQTILIEMKMKDFRSTLQNRFLPENYKCPIKLLIKWVFLGTNKNVESFNSKILSVKAR